MELLERFCAYLDRSPTPDHAVHSTLEVLLAHGFAAIDPQRPTPSFGPGFRGYVTKGASIVAFQVGSKPLADAGFRVVSAHTDSPNLRIKPNPYMRSNGYVRLGVEVYGGAINATWSDRDLGIAGVVTVRDGAGLRKELVRLDKPICRIPNLAIHLNRDVNTGGLSLNAQTQMPAVFSQDGDDADPLRTLIAAQLGVTTTDVLTWDLSLFDLTPARILGANDEFLASARLDNLASCHAGLEALIGTLDAEPHSTAVLALFDHEEVGSRSATGADSSTLEEVLTLIHRGVGEAAEDLRARALANTWLISADMAHAVHPAYPDKHDGNHMPLLNAGPVIKRNANQRYGTEAETSAMFVLLAERAEVPLQWFVNRSDLACGSTVGPILAGRLGVRTIDIGNPMLSMHSAREMCGTADHGAMVKVLQAFYSSPRIA